MTEIRKQVATASTHPVGLPMPPLSDGYTPKPFTHVGVDQCASDDVYIAPNKKLDMWVCKSRHVGKQSDSYDEAIYAFDYNSDGAIDSLVREVRYFVYGSGASQSQIDLTQRHAYVVNAVYQGRAGHLPLDKYVTSLPTIFIHNAPPTDYDAIPSKVRQLVAAGVELFTDFQNSLKTNKTSFRWTLNETITCRVEPGEPVTASFTTSAGLNARFNPANIMLTSARAYIVSSNGYYDRLFHYALTGQELSSDWMGLTSAKMTIAAQLPVCISDREGVNDELYDRQFFGK